MIVRKKAISINLEKNIIGFVGSKHDDLVIWISRFFSNMNQKVLVIDYTMEESLGYLFPLPKGYSQVRDTEFEYQGIFYVNTSVNTKINQFTKDYDIIIASFGKKIMHQELKKCDVLYSITYPDIKEIETLKGLHNYENNYLVVRDDLHIKNMDDFILQELGFSQINSFFLERNNDEYRQFVLGQWNKTIEIRNLSYDTKDFFIQVAKQLGINNKVCKEALKAIRKRKVS